MSSGHGLSGRALSQRHQPVFLLPVNLWYCRPSAFLRADCCRQSLFCEPLPHAMHRRYPLPELGNLLVAPCRPLRGRIRLEQHLRPHQYRG